jgi:hypothetical protein
MAWSKNQPKKNKADRIGGHSKVVSESKGKGVVKGADGTGEPPKRMSVDVENGLIGDGRRDWKDASVIQFNVKMKTAPRLYVHTYSAPGREWMALHVDVYELPGEDPFDQDRRVIASLEAELIYGPALFDKIENELSKARANLYYEVAADGKKSVRS